MSEKTYFYVDCDMTVEQTESVLDKPQVGFTRPSATGRLADSYRALVDAGRLVVVGLPPQQGEKQ